MNLPKGCHWIFDNEILDDSLTSLLHEVYVRGGFTPLERAISLFEPSTLRPQGTLIGIQKDAQLMGFVMLVPAGSPHCKLAQDSQAEMRLLAVRPEQRGQKLGQALVEKVLNSALAQGAKEMILWTQSRMKTAQRLYLKSGFEACPTQNFNIEDREFWVFKKGLLFEK